MRVLTTPGVNTLNPLGGLWALRGPGLWLCARLCSYDETRAPPPPVAVGVEPGDVDVEAPTACAHALVSLAGTHRTSATRCRTRGAYHFTRSTCSTRTDHSLPKLAAAADTSSSRRFTQTDSSPLAQLPCTCNTPPLSRSAATAVDHARSLSGSNPKSTRSATPVGATRRLSPSRTSHRVSSKPFFTKFFRSASTLCGFHSHATTLATPAWCNSCNV
mmetsp:Transcript_12331/g.45954  ORF Transcript_12331/g.45954 Transcript_12331/m.45954 type:complete len:217 (+) Transcript_12331:849-1499(+)